MDPAGPSAKKMKLAPSSIHEASANDPKPPTATERSQETPAGEEQEGGEELPDRISDLSDAVLGEIISLLPTREGARTQALASRWRHLWCAAPLNLDYRSLPGDRDRQDVLAGVILSAHQGPGRRLCLPAPRLQYPADAAETWLLSPALDNLEELDLYLAFSRCSQPEVPPPASTFRFSSTLRVLTMSQCHFPDHISGILRFPLLRKLGLMAVRISECSLHSIIATACCPVLESLLLNIACFGARRLRINSPTIISIGIRSSSGELIIEDAPALQRLVHFGVHMKMQLTVVSAPKLETLGYISEYFGQSKIVFGSTVIQGLRIGRLKAVVSTVKTLAISLYIFDLDMVVDLMRCFPCLEKLYIKIEQSGGKKLWRRKHRNLLGSLDICLKTLVLGCYQGIQPQVKFATFLVLNARMLQSVILDVEPCNYKEIFVAEQHRMLQMEKRASRDARLCFTSNCPHDAIKLGHLSDLDLTDPFACAC